MTVFPDLIPSTRTYSPGEFPHSVHGVYDGSQARVRHSNTVLGVRLRLFFPAITTADLLTVIAHYQGQRGRFLPFSIPDELLSGTDAPADFTPAGHTWRYAAKPTVEDISVDGASPTNLHNLTVEMETVPPENTIIQGARLRVRTELRPGSAQLGEFFDVQATLDAGAPSVQLDLLASVLFEPGSPFPVVNFDVVATLEAGQFVPPPNSLFAVTATLAPGAASSVSEFDPLDLSPVAWWDASDTGTVTTSGGFVTDWTDKSGNGWHLTQATSTQRPAYTASAINGLHALEWPTTNNDDHLQNNSGSTFTIQELYVVLQYSGGSQFSNYDGILGENMDHFSAFYICGSDNNPSLQGGGGFGFAYVNGNSGTNRFSNVFPEIQSPCLLRVAGTSASTSSTGIRVGLDRNYAHLNRAWSGYIAEMVVCSASLSSGDRTNLETYLMDKWGV